MAGLGFGPVGALVGALIGAAIGGITGWLGGKKIANWVDNTVKDMRSLFDMPELLTEAQKAIYKTEIEHFVTFMNKKKLQKARNKIDQLDKEIFYLIKKRTTIVKYMLSLKGFKSQIVDHKRIKEILKKIKNKSIKNRIDPKITSRIWKSIIWSYVDFQRRNFKNK